MKQEISLTDGKLLPKIIRFVLPLMLTNLLQMLYSAADMIVVGLSDTEGAIGAIGTTSAYINLLINLFIGFSVGANVVVARLIGAGDEEKCRKAVHTSLVVSVIAGIVCGGLGLLISRPVLALMGDEGHILTLALTYTTIYFCGAPFLAAANDLSAIFRAKGDTRTPLYILAGSGLLNVALNLLFVLGFGRDVDGVAYATVISNAASVVMLAVVLAKREDPFCRLRFRELRVDRRSFGEILHMGLPAGVQGALFSLSNMLISSSIIGINNRLCPGGSAVIDGNAAACSLEGFIYTATNSVYQAAVTFTSQHLGAGKTKRIKKVAGCCYLVTGCIALIGTAILVGLETPLLSLYIHGAAGDPLYELAMEAGRIRILIMIVPYILLAFMETGSGVLRGLGRSVTSTVVSLIGSCVLRIIWIYTVFRLFPTLQVVYLSYPVSWALTAFTHFICWQAALRRSISEKAALYAHEEEKRRQGLDALSPSEE